MQLPARAQCRRVVSQQVEVVGRSLLVADLVETAEPVRDRRIDLIASTDTRSIPLGVVR
jgi:hypothetical protein